MPSLLEKRLRKSPTFRINVRQYVNAEGDETNPVMSDAVFRELDLLGMGGRKAATGWWKEQKKGGFKKIKDCLELVDTLAPADEHAPGIIVPYSDNDIAPMASSQMGGLSVGSRGYGTVPYSPGYPGSGFVGMSNGQPLSRTHIAHHQQMAYPGQPPYYHAQVQPGGVGVPHQVPVALSPGGMYYPVPGQPHIHHAPTGLEQYHHQDTTRQIVHQSHQNTQKALENSNQAVSDAFQLLGQQMNAERDARTQQMNAERDARTKKEKADAEAQANRDKAQAEMQAKLVELAGSKANGAPNNGDQGLGDKFIDAFNKFTVTTTQLGDQIGRMSNSFTNAVDKQVSLMRPGMSNEELFTHYTSNRVNVAAGVSADQFPTIAYVSMSKGLEHILENLEELDISLSKDNVLAIIGTKASTYAFIKFGELVDGSSLEFHYGFESHIAAPLYGFTKFFEITVSCKSSSEEDGMKSFQLIVMMPSNNQTFVMDSLLRLIFEKAQVLNVLEVEVVGAEMKKLHEQHDPWDHSHDKAQVLPATLENAISVCSPESPKLTLHLNHIKVQDEQARVLAKVTPSNVILNFNECVLPIHKGSYDDYGNFDYHLELQEFYKRHNERKVLDCDDLFQEDEAGWKALFSKLAACYGVPNPLDSIGRNIFFMAMRDRDADRFGPLKLTFSGMHPEDSRNVQGVQGALSTFIELANGGKISSLKLCDYVYKSEEEYNTVEQMLESLKKTGCEVVTSDLEWEN